MSNFLAGIIGSLLAGLATAIGGVPVLFSKVYSRKVLDTMLGFSAGVMLAATAFSLLVPAIRTGGVWKTSIGVVMGSIFVELVDRYIPHEHFFRGHEGPPSHLKKIFLLMIAITIHNFPEGMAVGVGFGSGNFGMATSLAIAIGIQNIPEGSAVAMPLLKMGFSKQKAFLFALLSGLVEPVGGLIGAGIVSFTSRLLPYMMGLAAGAMIYVISDEMIPESHSEGNEKNATFGVISGFLVMMILDNIFG